MTVELVSNFDKIIEQIAEKLPSPLLGLEGLLQQTLRESFQAGGSKEMLKVTATTLLVLSVCHQFFQTLRGANGTPGAALSPIQPNSYRLVDLWGESLALKSQLAEVLTAASEGKGDSLSAFVLARTEGVLLGARELLLGVWRDISALRELSHRDQEIFQVARKALLGLEQGELRGSIQRHLDSI